MSNAVQIGIGFRGTVTGLTRSDHHQRATVEVKNSAGRTLASTSLIGNGDNAPMTQEINTAIPAWSFGPFNEPMNITIKVEHSVTGAGGVFVNSRIVQPVTVRKDPDASSPQTFVVSTVSAVPAWPWMVYLKSWMDLAAFGGF